MEVDKTIIIIEINKLFKIDFKNSIIKAVLGFIKLILKKIVSKTSYSVHSQANHWCNKTLSCNS